MLSFDVITIFPAFFRAVFDYGIVRRARIAQLVEIETHDLRDWTTDKHHIVDDRPFGGGDGMVLKPEPLFAAVEALTNEQFDCGSIVEANSRFENLRGEGVRIVLLSPQGRVLTQEVAQEFATNAKHMVIICGRYEGVDERVAQFLATDEISIGDYVLSGGEAAAIVLIDAIVRLVPGALGSETSAVNESFSAGALDYPHYTRPPEFRGATVPEVLLSGNHAEIARWRKSKAMSKTRRNRPDLFARIELDADERALIEKD